MKQSLDIDIAPLQERWPTGDWQSHECSVTGSTPDYATISMIEWTAVAFWFEPGVHCSITKDGRTIEAVRETAVEAVEACLAEAKSRVETWSTLAF